MDNTAHEYFAAPRDTSVTDSSLSPQFFLADHVWCCLIDEGAILLDLRSNQYLPVNQEDLVALQTWVAGIAVNAHPQGSLRTCGGEPAPPLLAEFVNRGLLTATPSNGNVRISVVPTAEEAMAPGCERVIPIVVRWRHIANFLASLLYVTLHLRRARLNSIIDHLRLLGARHRPRPGSTSAESVPELLGVFRRLRTLTYTAHDECLFDALVLADFLHRFHKAPTFFIGVATKPFLAHAWVQIGECVVDDRLERIRTLTPILAV